MTKSKNTATSPDDIAVRIKEVLRFERFYSRRLREATKAARVNEVNVAELGIFHELLQGPSPPGWLSWRLDLDPGQLSRTLKQLELMRYISVCGAKDDKRQRQVSLTDWGHKAARSLEQFQEERVRKTLKELPRRQQRRLVQAMGVIVGIFERDALTNLVERCKDEARTGRPER